MMHHKLGDKRRYVNTRKSSNCNQAFFAILGETNILLEVVIDYFLTHIPLVHMVKK